MNPELPQARPNHEVAPNIPGGVEYTPEVPSTHPERERTSPERVAPAPAESTPKAPPVSLPQVAAPVVQAPTIDSGSGAALQDDDTPLVAGDDDIIEKEWVDKLKKIIALTKDDPYERNRVITQLKADYLKKRHNRVVGESNNNQGV